MFARLVFEGMPAYKAYKEAGYKVDSPEVAFAASSRLLSNVKVKNFMDGLRSASDRASVATYEEKRKILSIMMHNHRNSERDRQKAIEIDNKMAGHDAPQVVEVKGSLIDQLRQ